jgi:hypothetical protein
MARIIQGILGGVSGTLGTVVGFITKGGFYLRVKAKSHKDANTEKQAAQRSRFAACVKLAKSLKFNIIRPIWSKMSGNLSGHNLFLQTNVSLFAADGTIADYDRFLFSVGNLPLPENIAVVNTAAGNGAISITWTDNSGVDIAASSDRLRVVALTGNDPVVFTGLSFTRNAQQASIQLPYGAGEAVHVYVFFEDEAGANYSDSVHSLVNIPAVAAP